jgi:predicted transcriptional regulator
MDWQRVITDITDCGYSQGEIARRCRTSQPYISQLQSGARGCADPSYSIGSRLIRLRTEAKRRAQAHRPAGSTSRASSRE